MQRKEDVQIDRLVCWNLNGRLKTKGRRDRILDIILNESPTILCLQEVMSIKELRWLTAALGKRTKKKWLHSPLHNGGMCVVSSEPLRIDAFFYSNSPLSQSYCNGLVGLCLDSCWWFSIHLDSRQYLECETLRWTETRWILKTIARLLRDSKIKNCVLAGDWNSISHLDNELTDNRLRCKSIVTGGKKCRKQSCNPTSLPSALLASAGFRDLITSVTTPKEKAASATWMPSKFHERIDRIYVKGTIQPSFGSHLKTIVAPNWPTGKDHRMLSVQLTLREGDKEK